MTSKAILLGLATALALGAPAASVSAQGRTGAMTPPAFSELDADGNGFINRADLTAQAAARFAAADTDGNGVLSAAELGARAMVQAEERSAKMAERMINMMDKDGDGGLSADEMDEMRGGAGRSGGMLGRADTDRDGAVSEAEYDAAIAAMAERGGKERGKHRGHGKGDRRGHGGN